MIKIGFEDLQTVEIGQIEQINELFLMTYAEDVVIFVVDKVKRLVGIVTQPDYNKECPLEDRINRKPLTLTESEGEIDNLVRKVFSYSSINFVPVLDDEGKLLYCYFRTRDSRMMSFDPIMAQTQVFTSYQQKVKRYKDYKVLLLTDVDVSSIKVLRENLVRLCDVGQYENKDNVIFALSFYEADSYTEAIEVLKKYNLKYIGCAGCFRARTNTMKDTFGPVTDYLSLDKAARKVLTIEASRRGRYFSLMDMENICQIIKATEMIAGDYLEIGVFRGDTARLALSYMKESGIKRNSFFLDTFEGFTYDDAYVSGDFLWRGSHTQTSMDLVKKRLKGYEGKCIACNIITDELPNEIGSIAVCNIDVDMEEAIASALLKVSPKMSRGGIIISEDYGHMPGLSGANYAVNSFIKENKDKFLPLYFSSGQMILVRR